MTHILELTIENRLDKLENDIKNINDIINNNVDTLQRQNVNTHDFNLEHLQRMIEKEMKSSFQQPYQYGMIRPSQNLYGTVNIQGGGVANGRSFGPNGQPLYDNLDLRHNQQMMPPPLHQYIPPNMDELSKFIRSMDQIHAENRDINNNVKEENVFVTLEMTYGDDIFYPIVSPEEELTITSIKPMRHYEFESIESLCKNGVFKKMYQFILDNTNCHDIRDIGEYVTEVVR